MTKQFIEYIESYGFKRFNHVNSDSDYVLRLRHKFLNRLQIYIEDNKILVFVHNTNNSSELIIEKRLTKLNLKQILIWLV